MQWAAGRHPFVLFSDVTNSRDGTARGGLACLWRRWFLFLSILRTISALEGETSPCAEHLFSRTAVKSKLGVTDCKSAKDTASIWHRIHPPTPPSSSLWISGLWGRRYATQGELQTLSKIKSPELKARSASKKKCAWIRYWSDAAAHLRDFACRSPLGCLFLCVCAFSARNVQRVCVRLRVGIAHRHHLDYYPHFNISNRHD